MNLYKMVFMESSFTSHWNVSLLKGEYRISKETNDFFSSFDFWDNMRDTHCFNGSQYYIVYTH